MDRFREPQIPMVERIPLIKELVGYLTNNGFKLPESYNGSKFIKLFYRNGECWFDIMILSHAETGWKDDLPENTFRIQVMMKNRSLCLNGEMTTIVAKTKEDFLKVFNAHKMILIEEDIQKHLNLLGELKSSINF